MAKVSDLPAAGALTGAEHLIGVQGGSSVKVSVAAVLANILATLPGPGLATGNPTQAGSYDTFTAHSPNAWTYAETVSGTNYASIPIPNRAAGSVLTIAYQFVGAAGGLPFARLFYSDSSSSPVTPALIADGKLHVFTLTVEAGKTATRVRFGTTGIASGLAFAVIEDGAIDKASLITAGGGLRSLLWSLVLDLAGVAGGAGVSHQQLKAWAVTEAWPKFQELTVHANGYTATANIEWPDGSTGVYASTEDPLFGISAFTVTHLLSGLTVTQPTITRNANGKPTLRPVPTVAPTVP